jgi:hypothetical protein
MTTLSLPRPSTRPSLYPPYQRALDEARLTLNAAIVASAAGGGAWHGHLVFEGVMTGDKREMAPGSLKARPGTLPLMALDKTTAGHWRAELAGAIEDINRLDGGVIAGEGHFAGTERGQYYEGLNAPDENGVQMLRWVSVDLQIHRYERAVYAYDEEGNEKTKLLVHEAEIMGATLCPFAAFYQAIVAPKSVDLAPMAAAAALGARDLGGYVQEPTDAIVASAAADGPPPIELFLNPNFTRLTHTSVRDVPGTNWRHFAGHLADWNTPHIGIGNGNVYAPHSPSDYAYYMTKPFDVAMADGVKNTPVGVLTLGGGHADINLGWRLAAEHYDNPLTGRVDLRVGEDEFGPWVSGVVRPSTTYDEARVLHSSDISGDWRRIGAMELVGIAAVNVAGFPTVESAYSNVVDARAAFTASASNPEGEMMSLVAAGMLRHDPTASALQRVNRRLAALEETIALGNFEGLALERAASMIANGR